MDKVTRKAVEDAALALWEGAGRPSGNGLALWLQAEMELGLIAAPEPDDPFVKLLNLAAHLKGELEAAGGSRGGEAVDSSTLH